MERLIERIKELEAPQIVIYSLCAIAFTILCYGIFSGGDDIEKVNTTNTLELPEDGRPVTNYESKMEAYGVKEERDNGIDLDFDSDFFSKDSTGISETEQAYRDKLNSQIAEIESKNDSGIYDEEDSRIIKDLQNEIANEKPRKNPVAKSNNYPDTPKLSYEEKLQKAREARLGNQKVSETPTIQKIETRAAIFRDQFRLPGELVEMVLTKSFRHGGKTFEKGTPIYADLNINKSRVLFEITNIAHVPLKVEVRDIRDGRIGMYSTRAGELWKRYEAEAINRTAQSVGDEITTNRILSSSIDAISGFFQKKRLKENEKILLLNDQELIVYIIEEL
ncbi:conjugative transposon protein TraM [Maribacter sp. 4G9]|uniref:conjugative transposon protein TraM n=1 Tax=Maribacter sp. 4G9 TaxID=1889777 RepID=UPI000C152A8D|nr:conjugative transposon protein TraM [Maribacter sp. 4G9]PIB39068.1 hypothetical protein BFP75_00910 [Maribacter sp. 4G9]